MTVTTITHLNLPGTAREALAFYGAVFGGDATITSYGDVGMPRELSGADKVVFGRLDAGAVHLLAYDIPGQGGSTPAPVGTTRRENGVTLTDSPFFLALEGASLDEVQPLWDALADRAEIVEPFAASAWSPGFGMLTDRFGVTWAVSVVAAP